MAKPYQRIVCWLRRDLRLHDNTALYHAARDGAEVVPLFVFDTTILDGLPRDDARVGFLKEAVRHLDGQLRARGTRLALVYGDPQRELPRLLQQWQADALYHNAALSAAGQERDAQVAKRCAAQGVAVKTFDDALTVPHGLLPPRKVFSAFYRLWRQHAAPALFPLPRRWRMTVAVPETETVLRRVRGGSSAWDAAWGRKRLRAFAYGDYERTRNLPGLDGTSRLSPYIRFGLISPREALHAARARGAETFISELAWREFWHHIARHFPDALVWEFQAKRRHLRWENDGKLLRAWERAETGYPYVDAGLRQLHTEGWMHGRVRMMVASFLCKDLLCDWRPGERHFARWLLDYDAAVNIGNWQWSASVGADPKPVRIFSPLLQAQRFDADAAYIRQWLPELKHLPAAQLHDPLTHRLPYVQPVVDHRVQAAKAKSMYRGGR